ncbi:MAG: hypothetical protein JOZ44_00630 [Acidobacteria bacterium]|nr:hypothetical protein [Acidobacteriota bacterium]
MISQNCTCGHAKRDHNIVKSAHNGACKVCLCDSYQPVVAEPVVPVSEIAPS